MLINIQGSIEMSSQQTPSQPAGWSGPMGIDFNSETELSFCVPGLAPCDVSRLFVRCQSLSNFVRLGQRVEARRAADQSF